MRESSDRDSCELQPLFQKRGLRAMTEPPQARSTIPLCAYTPNVRGGGGPAGREGEMVLRGGRAALHAHARRCFEKRRTTLVSSTAQGRFSPESQEMAAPSIQSSLFLCPLKRLGSAVHIECLGLLPLKMRSVCTRVRALP